MSTLIEIGTWKSEVGSTSSVPSIDEKDPEEHQVSPDGGLHAWVCVLGAFFCQISSFGFISACGIFQTHYELVLLKDYSSSSIAWITTTQIFFIYVLGGVIGILVDAFGPRKIIIPSSLISVLGLLMLSMSTKYWEVLLSQGVVYGIGAAGLFLPGIVTTGQWFTTNRGLAMGLVASGSSVGGVIFPFMITELINRHGFPTAVRWTALLLAIILSIACICVSPPFPPKGFVERKSGGFQAFKSVSWIGYTVGCFFVFWGLFTPFDYLPLMALKAGFSNNLARYSIAITNAASIIGRILPAFISDHVGEFNTMCAVAMASGLSILGLWLPLEEHNNHPGILAFGAIFGFASGGFISLLIPCIVRLSNGQMEDLGARTGAFLVVMGVAALTGLPIQGAIFDKNPDTFVGLIVFAGVMMTFGGCIIVGVRIRRGGISITTKV
ncbi:MFS transporter [Terfezia boudieri ATCC MYA-4762]|uniref:MFS transporter n=1 Tax=Terfezia boudieri ATCC MYA-4762 TaxID=1051890 RepID=A0A3N4L814_9PEZI|nr:MFS transporter [Terfezia boudieri ATCC MYA-4762]